MRASASQASSAAAIGAVTHPPGLREVVEVVEAGQRVVLVVLPVPEQHLVTVADHVPRHPVTVPGRRRPRLVTVLVAASRAAARPATRRPGSRSPALRPRGRAGAAAGSRQAAGPVRPFRAPGERLHRRDRHPGRGCRAAGRVGRRGTAPPPRPRLGPAQDGWRRHRPAPAARPASCSWSRSARSPVDGVATAALGEGHRAPGRRRAPAAPRRDRAGGRPSRITIVSTSGTSLRTAATSPSAPRTTTRANPGSAPQHPELWAPRRTRSTAGARWPVVGTSQRADCAGAGCREQQDGVRHPSAARGTPRRRPRAGAAPGSPRSRWARATRCGAVR